MKPEDQIKALAELAGYTPQKSTGIVMDGWKLPKGGWVPTCQLPQWITSYDAIIPLLQKQSEEVRVYIHRSNFGDFEYDKTPAQLCEALLRAIGKWTDEKGTE